MDWSAIAKTAAPGLADLIGKGGAFLFGNQKNPADAAMPYLDQMTSNAQNTYSPYINAGQEALPGLQKQYGALLENPGGRLNEIGSDYHESPGYQWALKQALNAGAHKAGAGGYAGTPMHEQQSMQTATGLADQDYYNWLNHATNLYGQGLHGQQGLYDTGFQGSNNMAQMIQDALTKKAETQYAGQQEENKNNSGSIWGTIGNLAGSLLPMFF